MREHYEDRRSVLEKQGRINTKDGQDVDIAMVYSIISSSEGHPLSAIINVRDISRLKESEDLRTTFLSMIGHELQTPLSIIKGFASTLTRSDGKWNEKSIRDGLQVVEEECDHMNKLVERILLASRIEAGALTLRKDSVQLRSLAGKVVRRFQNVTSIHNFKITFAPKFPAVKVDPDLIEEVLSNLVDNAVKYSPEGGEVTISGTVSNNHVEVIVTDEGIGIPLRDLDYIFDRFHRVDTTSVLKIRGVGLGLYLCRYIVEAHGGSISATSELGKGSQLAFTLPLHPTSHDMP
jgi:signal transduction histidine kinase